MNRQSTLCYIEKDGKYLMLHRVVKKNDVNKDKWIGVGGHFEYAESPEECLLREVRGDRLYIDFLEIQRNRDICIWRRCGGIYVTVYSRRIYR